VDSEFGKLIFDAFDAYQRGDDAALQEIYDPEIEVHADAGVNSGTFHGWDGFRQWVSQWEDAWEEITYEPKEVIEFGTDLAVVPVQTAGRGRGSGIELEQEFVYVFQRREGRLIRFHLYPTRERALAVAQEFAAEES
jgi:ketosteroid isomerase-like protein